MDFRIVPYKRTSESAKLLASELSVLAGKRIISGSPSYDHKNILWGSSDVTMENFQPTSAINIAKSKLNAFNKLKTAGVSIPEFTTSKTEAKRWLDAGSTVLARQLLNGSCGRGIVVCERGSTLPNAPLYVKYIKKSKEFRVHVMNGQAIDVQEKRRRSGNPNTNSMIRNHDNGWVFCHEDIREPSGLRELGVKAVQGIGLLFGAVDIIYNEYYRKLYVLEVNTAPGLSETTAKKYAAAMMELR